MEALQVFVYPLPIAVIGMLIGGLLVARRSRLGALLLFGLLIGLWLLATQPVSQALRHQLEARFPAVPAEAAPSADAIVVLGGGVLPAGPSRATAQLNNAGDRLRMAHDLYRAGRAPLIITTGGAHDHDPRGEAEAEAAARLLRRWGVPAAAIISRSDSRTTYEDAVAIRGAIEGNALDGILLVTSAMHMPRAMATFRALGIDAEPIPADFRAQPERIPSWDDWVPRADTLALSRLAWHEHVAMLHYRMRGWAVAR